MQLFDAIPWQWYILVPVLTFSTWNKPISLPTPHCNKERMGPTYLEPWSWLGHSRWALSCPALQRKWQSLHPPVHALFHPQLLQPHPCSAMNKKKHIKDKSHSCITHDSASHTHTGLMTSRTVYNSLWSIVQKCFEDTQQNSHLSTYTKWSNAKIILLILLLKTKQMLTKKDTNSNPKAITTQDSVLCCFISLVFIIKFCVTIYYMDIYKE